jgi:hypothetical protein
MKDATYPTHLLATAIGDKPPLGPVEEIEGGARCAVSGEPIRHGVLVKKAVTSAYSRFTDVFTDPDGWVSEAAAKCIANDWNLGCRLVLEDGTHYHPLINAEQAAKQDRPCFRDIVRDMWPANKGQSCLIIITTDVKKRAWPMARPGRLGATTPVTILAPEYATEECRAVDWTQFLAVLDEVEALYSRGYGKDAILTGLWRSQKAVKEHGAAYTLEMERRLQHLRTTPELLPATLIAQTALTTQTTSTAQTRAHELCASNPAPSAPTLF